jgi:hypothetical protein
MCWEQYTDILCHPEPTKLQNRVLNLKTNGEQPAARGTEETHVFHRHNTCTSVKGAVSITAWDIS